MLVKFSIPYYECQLCLLLLAFSKLNAWDKLWYFIEVTKKESTKISKFVRYILCSTNMIHCTLSFTYSVGVSFFTLSLFICMYFFQFVAFSAREFIAWVHSKFLFMCSKSDILNISVNLLQILKCIGCEYGISLMLVGMCILYRYVCTSPHNINNVYISIWLFTTTDIHGFYCICCR